MNLGDIQTHLEWIDQIIENPSYLYDDVWKERLLKSMGWTSVDIKDPTLLAKLIKRRSSYEEVIGNLKKMEQFKGLL